MTVPAIALGAIGNSGMRSARVRTGCDDDIIDYLVI
jgi:hypothetical protein